jgi:hypothetical protein
MKENLVNGKNRELKDTHTPNMGLMPSSLMYVTLIVNGEDWERR